MGIWRFSPVYLPFLLFQPSSIGWVIIIAFHSFQRPAVTCLHSGSSVYLSICLLASATGSSLDFMDNTTTTVIATVVAVSVGFLIYRMGCTSSIQPLKYVIYCVMIVFMGMICDYICS
ncbi:hypothetical protein EON65_39120 [archaeon]|nr:MAG: hypothetical protein EON65_39120 [archaeon]